MIQIGNTKIPEIELGAKKYIHVLPKCENSWLLDMNACKTGCIQKCDGDFKKFREDEYKRFK
jgi:hypothetical protein